MKIIMDDDQYQRRNDIPLFLQFGWATAKLAGSSKLLNHLPVDQMYMALVGGNISGIP